ncbi:hypothetical protein DPM35_27865 [Mesorhizobium atlanticum]|uniref:Uncharacterized protein n=1 Tax=Mesorhizobium atlanticum TaxID=2233532 RepID=A0A330GNJ0_9HYPH|nr:hypothetical protein DPM35_27865 [Mesorhizobium atlanticum]
MSSMSRPGGPITGDVTVIQKQARLTRYGVVGQSALTFDNSALFLPRNADERVCAGRWRMAGAAGIA